MPATKRRRGLTSRPGQGIAFLFMSGDKKKRAVGRWLWGIFGAWVVFLIVLSSMPGSRFGPSPFFEADKVLHFLLFAVGAGSLMAALCQTTGKSSFRRGLACWILMIGVGIADEIHQLYTPGRSGGDLGDLTADAAGAAFGICLILFLYGKRLPTRLGTPGPDRAA